MNYWLILRQAGKRRACLSNTACSTTSCACSCSACQVSNSYQQTRFPACQICTELNLADHQGPIETQIFPCKLYAVGAASQGHVALIEQTDLLKTLSFLFSPSRAFCSARQEAQGKAKAIGFCSSACNVSQHAGLQLGIRPRKELEHTTAITSSLVATCGLATV